MDIVKLLRTAVSSGASDLHICRGSPPAVRIDGRIKLLKTSPLTASDCERLVRQMVTDAQMEDFRTDKQLSFSRGFEDLGNFRVNIYSHDGVLEAAIRAAAARTFSLDELGVPRRLAEMARRDSGLLLITGPTGSGKTTTFNALIDVINTEQRRKVITIEDPVEYRHAHKLSLCVQLEVGLDTPNFATALKHALRQDPDVICVGELRDLESISVALTAAETGHLVIGTLHTPSAAGTITRLIDVFPPHQQSQVRVQLASNLQGVLAQRLLPLKSKRGRVLACELLVVNDAVRTQIREGKQHLLNQTMELGKSKGMLLMDDSVLAFLNRGLITRETAARAVSSHQVLS